MHYKNGREARNGDHVIGKFGFNGEVISGVIFAIQQGSQSCNCNVQIIVPGGSYTMTCRTVGELYNAEDAFDAIEPKITTVTATTEPASPPTATETMTPPIAT